MTYKGYEGIAEFCKNVTARFPFSNPADILRKVKTKPEHRNRAYHSLNTLRKEQIRVMDSDSRHRRTNHRCTDLIRAGLGKGDENLRYF